MQLCTAAKSAEIDDGMSFSPWHGLAAYRPIGGIIRARKPAYQAGVEFRARHNGRPVREPSHETT